MPKSISNIIIVLGVVSGLAVGHLFAKETDTVRCNIADSAGLRFEMKLPAGGSIDFSADFVMSNPTMFYPGRVYFEGASAEGISFTGLNDSTYSIKAKLTPVSGDVTTIIVQGIALMPSANEGCVYLRNCLASGRQFPDGIVCLIVSSEAGNITYLRYPKVLNVYPSPIRAGDYLNLEYRTDRLERVKIDMINSAGYIATIDEFDVDRSGTFTRTMRIPPDFPSGVFFIALKTAFGYSFTMCEVIR